MNHAATKTARPDAGALRQLLSSDPQLAARIIHNPFGHDNADTWVSVQSVLNRDTTRARMRRKRDLGPHDVLAATTDAEFHVPLQKRFRHDASSRREEMTMCMHAHIIRALDVLSALSEATHMSRAVVACARDTPGAASDTASTCAEVAQACVRDTHGAASDTASTCAEVAQAESETESDDDAWFYSLLGLGDSCDDSSDVNVQSISKDTCPYSSLAQLDGGATKSISSRSDLFSHIDPTPGARVRVADGRALGGSIGEGPLNAKSGFPGTRAIYASEIQGTLLSQTQLVRESNLSFVHTPDACFMQQHIPGKCPICHPHLTRRNLLVKDSKIFVPILAAVPEHHDAAAHKFWNDGNSSDVKELTFDSVVNPTAGVVQTGRRDACGQVGTQCGARTHIGTQAGDRPHDVACSLAQDELPSPRELFPGAKQALAPALAPAGALTPGAEACNQGTQTDTSQRKLLDEQRKILWHARMPTAGCAALSALARSFPDTFRFSPDTILPPCHACARARIRKAAAPPASTRVVQPLEEVHFDLFFVCGEIVLIFIDRASRYEWIYFLDKKSDLPKTLQ